MSDQISTDTENRGTMTDSHKILILGASYGSLLGTKLLLAGYEVTLVCTQRTAGLINSEGTVVRLPVRGRDELVTVASGQLANPGALDAKVPDEVNVNDYDMVVLGMQEPQYGSPGVRELLDKVALADVPCVAIMNMPPLPYLERLPGVDSNLLLPCFTEPDVWKNFNPARVTLASPDPQAFRPADEGKNVLQVSLPTNFKVARFGLEKHTGMLKDMQLGIESVEFPVAEGTVKLPVKLKLHESLYVPLAKWAMLITGNYRCVQKDQMRSIAEAVHGDLVKSRQCYDWVAELCIALGASADDMVPFDKYANAAKGLSKPSSAARALFGGSTHIERVDLLVQKLAAQKNMQLPELDATVDMVNARLESNRLAAQRAAS